MDRRKKIIKREMVEKEGKDRKKERRKEARSEGKWKEWRRKKDQTEKKN